MNHPDFTKIDRGGWDVWVHKTAPVWICHYEAIEDSQSFRHAFYQPYIAIEPVKRGAAVWSANNKRVGKEGAFRTLEAAMLAALEVVAQKEAA